MNNYIDNDDKLLFNKVKRGEEINKYEVAYLITNFSVDCTILNIFNHHQKQQVIIDIGNDEYYSLIYFCVYYNDKDINVKNIYKEQVAKKMIKEWKEYD